MIETEGEYLTSKLALDDVEKALIALKEKVYSINPEKYHLLANPYLKQILKLRTEIDDYVGITSAVEVASPLWVRLVGDHIGEGESPMGLLSGFLNNFRLATQRIAEYIDTVEIRTTGRPKDEYRDICNFRVRIYPGSLRLGFSFPIPTVQATLDQEPYQNLAKESVKKLMLGTSWVVGLENRPIEELFPTQEERYLVMSQIHTLTPRTNGEIKSVQFYGKELIRDEIMLREEHSQRVRQAMTRELSEENYITEGTMRELDLDKQKFILRNRPDREEEILCHCNEIPEIFTKEGFDHRVRVYGIIHNNKRTNKPSYIDVKKIDIPLD